MNTENTWGARLYLFGIAFMLGCGAQELSHLGCRCEGDVPEGRLNIACGQSQCVAGIAGYRCVGENTAVVNAHACRIDDAGVSRIDADKPRKEDAGEPDAGLPPGMLRGVGTSHATCAEGCTSIGFSCVPTCEDSAGLLSYGYYDWDYGLYRAVHTESLEHCDATPSETYDHSDGETYELSKVFCCCDIPEVSIVNGVVGETCAQTCMSRGHSDCAEFHEWPGEEANGGTLVTYSRPETGSTTKVVMGCEATPPAERRIAGALRYLSYWSCACY